MPNEMHNENISGNIPISGPAAAPSAADPTTAAGVASSNAAPADVNASTKINNMADLREKAPKLWHAMMLGIAQNICSEWQHHADHLKRIMEEARANSG